MPDASQRVHVARQPILDAGHEVFGYELLYRAAATDTACVVPSSEASARVIVDGVLGIGFDVLTNGCRAFVNLSDEMLLSDASSLFEPGQVVLEILETVTVTPAVIDACKSLRQRGYALALDDFVPGSAAGALLPWVDYVKLDVLALEPGLVARTARALLARGLTIVAEKVETAAAYERARAAGCTLFQGYYFCRPVSFSGRTLSPGQVAQLRLLAALQQPTAALSAIEDLIKVDASLTYRVLRTVNSAGYGLRRQVASLREALLLIGLDQIRRWTAVWVLAGANRGPSELVRMAVLRGRTCELAGKALGQADGGASYFLLGLCSLLDAMLGRAMRDIVAELPLEGELRDALVGAANAPRRVLDAVLAHERGDFVRAAEGCRQLGLAEGALTRAYAAALSWARDLTKADTGPAPEKGPAPLSTPGDNGAISATSRRTW